LQAWLTSHVTGVIVALVGLVTAAVFVMGSRPAPPIIEVRPIERVPTPTSVVYVHIAGAVTAPGVYTLADGARIFEAIAAAGGTTEDANTDELNLVAKVADGQKLVIPARAPSIPAAMVVAAAPEAEELVSPPVAPAPTATRRPAAQAAVPGAKINLNTGTQKMLESLPGIGPVTARKIIDYRQANGRITSVEQLRDAKVINNSMYDKIKDLVST